MMLLLLFLNAYSNFNYIIRRRTGEAEESEIIDYQNLKVLTKKDPEYANLSIEEEKQALAYGRM